MQAFCQICFSGGSTAIAVKPDTVADLKTRFHQLSFRYPRPVIVIVGGAGGLRHYHTARLHSIFNHVLAPLAEALGAIVVDGGTDSGVMRMMGKARHHIRATFPLVGVLPVGVAALPDEHSPSENAAPLEPHHTHFVLVPGSNWGDDSFWIAEVANILSQGMPSITVLINGGEVTWKDASESVRAGRPIVAISNSGRTADALAAAYDGDLVDHRASAIVQSGLLHAVSLERKDRLESTLKQILKLEKPETANSRK